MADDDLKNVRISVLKHFEDQLSGTSAVDFDGVPFDSDSVTEWFRPRLSGPTAAPARSGERYETYTLDCGCFAKTGRDSGGSQQENIHRAWELAGSFRTAFNQTDVAVQDWDAVGDPTIGYVRFEEVSLASIFDDRKAHIQQVTASVTCVLIL